MFPHIYFLTFKILINTNISSFPFTSRRNHEIDERAPPLKGGGVDKNRCFEGFCAGRPKWFRMV